MNIYIQHDDVMLYGIHVKTFPAGSKESFDILWMLLETVIPIMGLAGLRRMAAFDTTRQ